MDQLREHLNEPSVPLVVGVSGGVDSMVLLTWLTTQVSPDQIHVAYVHHHARPETDAEAELVEQYAYKLGVDFHRGDFHYQTGNFQEAARNFRLKFFMKVAKDVGARDIYLGHHRDDAIETFLIKLLKKARPHTTVSQKERTSYGDYYLVRPFRKLAKAQLYEYAQQHNVPFCEDDSNQSDDYLRNALRNEVLAPLAKLAPDYGEAWQYFIEAMQLGMKLFDIQVAQFIYSQAIDINYDWTLDLTELLKLELPLQREVLFYLLFPLQLSLKNIDELLSQFHENQSHALIYHGELDGKPLYVAREYDTLVWRIGESPKVYLEITECGTYPLGDGRRIVVTKKKRTNRANSDRIWYNSESLPVIIRNWKPGDYIVCDFGTKKVSRILIDRKVEHHKRPDVLVLEKDGVVLSVIGFQASTQLQALTRCDMSIKLEGKK